MLFRSLRLFCTHGTPVQKTLHFWPALPIVMEYGGLPTLDPPAPEDEGDIIAALKQFDRVISISLTVTSSLMVKLSAIEKSFPELQELVLLSLNGELLALPSTFRCGQRLRRLHSTGIKFPALLLPLCLRSSTNLIDLQLHDAFLPWDFSPVLLKNVLSEMTQLRSLSLHFRSITNHYFPVPPYGERVVLPVLTRLNYQGSMAYLEVIVAMIDPPSLEDTAIDITSDNISHTLLKMKKITNWIEMHGSHRGTHKLSSEPIISISLIRSETPTCLKVQVLYKPSCVQISSINVVHTSRPTEIRKLLENVFPALHKLYIPQPGPFDAVLREALVLFMISHRRSGHPIEVEYEQFCHLSGHETGTYTQRHQYLSTF